MLISNRSKGLLLSLVGVLILSPDSLLIRLVNLDNNSLIFYRGLLPAIATSIFLFFFYKKNFINSFILIGKAGLIYAFLYSLIHITFVYSIQNTNVANTLVLIASSPILAAILSFIFLKEKQDKLTLIIIFTAFLSMVIIGWGSYTSKGLLGDVLAIITGFGMAASAIVARYYKKIDLVPACVLGCILTALYAFPITNNFTFNLEQGIYLFLIGFIVLPIPFIIITIVPRYPPAPEVTLIFLLESILGTLWVWIIINEMPSLNTLLGGSLLITSVFVFIYFTAKKEIKGKF